MENGVWIARDKNGNLAIFDDKPELDDNEWFNSRPFEGEYSCINKEMFPEITFENSPKQLIIKQD